MPFFSVEHLPPEKSEHVPALLREACPQFDTVTSSCIAESQFKQVKSCFHPMHVYLYM